ncbi:MAG: hypothetical protein NC411_01175 [Bacteroides sp.]|nr:hypothetical protein [Bacteroides sp.]
MNTALRINKAREALTNSKVRSIEFYKDGSGATFYYTDPTGDHGLPCSVASSFNIADTMKIIAGFRFKQHELNTCF